jgi:hypothetical protein
MADECGYSIKPVETRSPLRSAFLRIVPDSFLSLWLGDPTDQRRAFESKLEGIEDEVDSLSENWTPSSLANTT